MIAFDIISISLVALLVVFLTLGFLTSELEPEQDYISTPRINKPGVTARLCAAVYRIIYLLIGPMTLGISASSEYRYLTRQSYTTNVIESFHRWTMVPLAVLCLLLSIAYVFFVEVQIPSSSVLSGQSKLHALSMYMTLPLACIVGHPFISTIPALLCILSNIRHHPRLNIVLWI